jgi:hypothetical protein
MDVRKGLDLFSRQNGVPDEVALGPENGIALGKRGEFFRRTVLAMVVR